MTSTIARTKVFEEVKQGHRPESSKISCRIRPTCMHSLTNANMHSMYKMTKPYSQENKTRHRKFRLQTSIAKCYKA